MQRRYRIPSASALQAFESAARHCSFSRAATELSTSQPAVSRHVASLEARLGARLFERHNNRLVLTEHGDRFYRTVALALDNIQATASSIAAAGDSDELTIACTHEISHLFLLPRFEALQASVGETTQVRIVTSEYGSIEHTADPRIDLTFSYHALASASADRVMLLRERVIPVCSPAFARDNAAVLSQPVTQWGDLVFLRQTSQNESWASWEDWFEQAGVPERVPDYLRINNYVYLLEAAAAGRGLALGWRGLVERYLEAGSLVTVAGDNQEFDRALFALMTPRGRERAVVHDCLAFLEQSAHSESP